MAYIQFCKQKKNMLDLWWKGTMMSIKMSDRTEKKVQSIKTMDLFFTFTPITFISFCLVSVQLSLRTRFYINSIDSIILYTKSCFLLCVFFALFLSSFLFPLHAFRYPKNFPLLENTFLIYVFSYLYFTERRCMIFLCFNIFQRNGRCLLYRQEENRHCR